MSLIEKIFGDYSSKEIKRITPLADAVVKLDGEMSALSEEALKAKTGEFKNRLQNGETLDDILVEAFAVAREAAWRVLAMKPFYVQILGGIILHQGRIAEMKTGEGKTLVSTLPAYLNALSGKGVHIVTVNDYLAKRDSEWMGKIFKYLGLSVGLITHDVENEDRQAAYACDITYGTNNEIGFDYLRDNMVVLKEQMVQREPNYAIVDEVDSILIDEARTPLIISGMSDKSTQLYEIADMLAKKMKARYIKETDNKSFEDMDENDDSDYIVDEKAKSATLTPRGVAKAEAFFKLENLSDPENMLISHHINQAIKAYGTMKRDREYVVKDGQVIIVDEFTGRLMYGRRYSNGLHQAIEAKERVKVERESKTLATITFQNLFRLYPKLAGMTGTALTEEDEFRQIYSLDVVVIPTNKPMAREDMEDEVYRTENGKFTAVIRQIEECNKKGQPVLVGTVSIEKSELLSDMLKKKGIKHEVLNAKFHEKEAEIIAQAGKKGAVTIATNMAGRGTDIMLGGNAEYMAKTEMRRMDMSEEMIAESTGFSETDNEEILNARKVFKELNEKYKAQIKPEAEAVTEAGGLFVIGTERHESRRIDNQLRGRSGRQGDPGKSKFYISLEDDLMRLFGSSKVATVMEKMNVEEDMPITAKMLSGAIEKAQKGIEGRNFNIRRNVLQYDEVMNEQRKTIYGERKKVLDGENIHPSILRMAEQTVEAAVLAYASAEYVDDYDFEALENFAKNVLRSEAEKVFDTSDLNSISQSSIRETLMNIVDDRLKKQAEEFGDNMPELERAILLRSVDTHWMDHIDDMDQLKKGIGLNAYAQRDPVVEYRIVGSDMYDEMIASIAEDTTKFLLGARPVSKPIVRSEVATPTGTNMDDTSLTKQPVKNKGKVGRNDPCPCGSGKKYKHCCGR